MSEEFEGPGAYEERRARAHLWTVLAAAIEAFTKVALEYIKEDLTEEDEQPNRAMRRGKNIGSLRPKKRGKGSGRSATDVHS